MRIWLSSAHRLMLRLGYSTKTWSTTTMMCWQWHFERPPSPQPIKEKAQNKKLTKFCFMFLSVQQLNSGGRTQTSSSSNFPSKLNYCSVQRKENLSHFRELKEIHNIKPLLPLSFINSALPWDRLLYFNMPLPRAGLWLFPLEASAEAASWDFSVSIT